MNEHSNDKEKQTDGKKRTTRMQRERRRYIITAASCAAALAAIIVVAVVVTNAQRVKNNEALRGSYSSSSALDSSSSKPNNNGGNNGGTSASDEPVTNTPEEMLSPIAAATTLNDYGFYYNQTLHKYYEHQGVDYAAEAGTKVMAAASGTVESIYRGDVLSGTEITLDHGDGRKTVYRFVEAAEGLQVGDKVERGEVIATVAEATGDEYKDGAHLHFEVYKDGKCVDPASHLMLAEK